LPDKYRNVELLPERYCQPKVDWVPALFVDANFDYYLL